MKKIFFAVGLVVLVVVVHLSAGAAHALTLPAILDGRVFDTTGQPVAGARVLIANTITKTTDANGVYIYNSTSMFGTVTVSVSAPDCLPQSSTATLVSGRETVLNFTVYRSRPAASYGPYLSAARDLNSKMHLAYYSNKQLTYATDASGTWIKSIIDNSGDTGHYVSVALDGAGMVHISYYDAANRQLKYASNATGVWQTETVDAGSPNIGQFTRMALDAEGNPCITYYDFSNGLFKYAVKASGIWTATMVDSTFLAIDSAGIPVL